jgi:hypothetical protein
MAKRPAGLIYWVDEKPPAFELAVLAVQHIFLMSSTLVLPVVLVTEIGGGFDQVRSRGVDHDRLRPGHHRAGDAMARDRFRFSLSKLVRTEFFRRVCGSSLAGWFAVNARDDDCRRNS